MKHRVPPLGVIVAAFAATTAFGVTVFPNESTRCDARPGTAIRHDAGGWMEVSCDGTYGWPGVELRPANGGTFDLSGAGSLQIVVSNAGDRAETISAHVIAKGADRGKVEPRSVRVRPGECRTIHLLLADDRILTDEPVKLERMRGKVGCLADNGRNWAETASVEVFQCQPGNPHPLRFAVLDVRTAFEGVRPKIVPAADFFPFCDRYGQLRHLDWPGKIHSDEDLAEARRREEEWLAAHGDGPISGADKYGGWADGPQLKATGFFRTEKVDGKWWLVDPEGHLFFSLGITCVYIGMETVPDNRRHYFEWLPPWETLPSCWDDPSLRHVNFTQLNMERKYGADYRTTFADMAHRRFRAWGINTLGNWTPERIRLLRRTPYVATIDFSSKTRLAAVKKAVFGRKMPDVFSPQFAADVREQAQKLAEKIGDDPWCVGVFVDNELDWESPEDVPAVAEKYFSTVAAEVKAALPNHLYLGCRFAVGGDETWRAASRHCDVVSYNYYARRPEKELPSGSDDKPLLVGEFHFGALDRGSLATGCGGGQTFDQNERAQCFRDYVNFCLDDPRHVGCHWFQYTDQGITGRFDGENFNCGFIDVCDTPYPELVEACRATAAEMYPRRAAATPIGK